MEHLPKPPCRIVLCMGQHCNRDQRSKDRYRRLQELMGYPGFMGTPRNGIKWESANCLSQCELGPNLVIYPQGLWFHELDDEKLEEILDRLGLIE